MNKMRFRLFVTSFNALVIFNVMYSGKLGLAKESNIPKEESSKGLRGAIGGDDIQLQGRTDTIINSKLRHRSLIGLFEGDIVPDSKTILENYGPYLLKDLEDEGILNPPINDGGYVYQNVETSNRWSTRVNDIVHVPYVLSSQYNPTEVSTIKKALADLGDRSKVVKFVTRKYQSDYLMLKPISGCYSYVGKQGGEQDISLKGYCVSRGVTQHEVMHALGIFHEQSRPDRDEYVSINWQNIDSSRQHNFAKKTNTKTLGNAYDYGSVMHYPSRAFSNNNKETITTPNGQSIGQRSGADQKDILDIRLLYQCISGERTLSEYNDNRCTEDCKCWKGEKGCNGRNNACQGSLVCTNNMCQDGSGGSPNIGPSTAAPTASPRTASPRTTSPRTTSPRTTSPRTTSPRTTSPRTASPTASRRTASPTRSVGGGGGNSSSKLLKIGGACMSVDKNNKKNVTVWRCYNGKNQKWIYDDDTKTLKPKIKNGQLCLTWNSLDNNVITRRCRNGRRAQKWYIDEAVRGNMLMIRVGGTRGNCLTMTKDQNNRKNLVVDNCYFSDNQQFSFK